MDFGHWIREQDSFVRYSLAFVFVWLHVMAYWGMRIVERGQRLRGVGR